MSRRMMHGSGAFPVYADAAYLPKDVGPIDMHKCIKNKDLVVTSSGIQVANSQNGLNIMSAYLDWAEWLPFAARSYNISANIEDYVLLPTIAMLDSLPNRNAVAFPLKELIGWHRDAGMPAYRMWKGQPNFYEHNNADHTKALGVVVDVAMRKLDGYSTSDRTGASLHKLILLNAIDRTRAPEHASRVLSGDLRTTSMGAYVEGYSCSKCQSPLGQCSHLNPKRPYDFYIDRDNDLVFRNIRAPTPFENSLVEVPAYHMAVSDVAFDMNGGTPLQAYQ
jgi:hypothetical protein